jgi:hypothetical protein
LGSIRDDFEEEESDEDAPDKNITPGPGNYL